MMRFTRTAVVVVGLVVAVAMFRPTSVETQGAITTLQRIATLETQVATLQSQVAALLAANATQQGTITAEAAARVAADTRSKRRSIMLLPCRRTYWTWPATSQSI